MECMSNAFEDPGIRNTQLNTTADPAQLAVKGVYGINYVIAQRVHLLCTVHTDIAGDEHSHNTVPHHGRTSYRNSR